MQARQSLEIRQQQSLALTPQLQQSIRFLQLSTHDLDQEISQALMENPLLEREDDFAAEGESVPQATEVPEQDALPSLMEWPSRSPLREDDDTRLEAPQEDTLRDHLLRQLHATHAQAQERALVTLLIDDLDDNGYLSMSMEEIVDWLPPELGIEADDMLCALRLLQSFDPLGVGARTLSECLALQLRQADAPTEVLACAHQIVASHLDMLASGNTARLAASLGCGRELVQAAHALILRLEPKPARNWSSNVAEYIRPDILVRKVRGRWEALLNSAALPRLSVNRQYEAWLDQAGADQAMRQQLQQAHGLIRSLQQRGSTILRVAREIVLRQPEVFEYGMDRLRPMRLRDIAGALEMHESTISRATKRKYAQTPWGVVELNTFFDTAVGSDGDDAASARSVRGRIARMIAEEPVGSPLSDGRIAELLEAEGIRIARRTVAKYREMEGIETAQRRKARAAVTA
ncbi:RNA polymerase factor sigma-54 [Paracandidimonas soli]|uniref:RNA polymerase sigma-54 factor n=1 Tax=Paracandidimonas soli TaxID=1917182 RepID=A0A4V2VSM0_9BURK|nr:RNA polymerase factor sigma-54 [Paracandidimonas soli]TCV02690.1 RNA polymerase RpoN-/SigL-like sigma 54 subunit [Paracandidimonas soli]